jgi:hypothetical protein
MEIDAVLTASVVVLVGLWWLWRLRSGFTLAALPPELRSARLIYAERVFRFVGSVSVTAKVDRVYRTAVGEVVLVELKTRRARRAHLSDVIELSAQRIAVMAETGLPVARHAYVLSEAPAGRRTAWHRVDLLRQVEVTTLALRRRALLAGEADPRCARSAGFCRTCPFGGECRSS